MHHSAVSDTSQRWLPLRSSLNPSPIKCRFRRGDEWQSGRVRSLSFDTIAVSTGCPPRKGSTIEVEIEACGIEVTALASVIAVTPAETADLLGAYGFGACFTDRDRYVQHRLHQLLRRASDEEVLLEQPPRRRHPRFPVRWPVAVRATRRRSQSIALDVSVRGMYLVSTIPLEVGELLCFGLASEIDSELLRGDARVTRVLGERDAARFQLPAGAGVEIVSMEPGAARSLRNLVGRVSRRAQKRILVGAAPRRLPELASALRMVGYAVCAVTRPDDLMSHAAAPHAIDMALLDTELDLRGRTLAELGRDLRLRGIPCAQLVPDSPWTAWELADSVLLRP